MAAKFGCRPRDLQRVTYRRPHRIDPSGEHEPMLGARLHRFLEALRGEANVMRSPQLPAKAPQNENTASADRASRPAPDCDSSPRTARAEVKLNNSGAVFAREATVIGSVFLDCDKNGITRRPHRAQAIPRAYRDARRPVVVTDMMVKLLSVRPARPMHPCVSVAGRDPARRHRSDRKTRPPTDLLRGGGFRG